MVNLGVIAIILYIVIVAVLWFIPKKRLETAIKRDMGITETAWNRKDSKLNYFRMLALIGGLITVVIMLIVKFVILF